MWGPAVCATAACHFRALLTARIPSEPWDFLNNIFCVCLMQFVGPRAAVELPVAVLVSRITEWQLFKGTPGGLEAILLLWSQPALQEPCSPRPVLKSSQDRGWRLHDLSGQPVLMPVRKLFFSFCPASTWCLSSSCPCTAVKSLIL